MKTNQQIAEEMHEEYKRNLKQEEKMWNLSQMHYKKWEESDCEDDEAHKAYEDALKIFKEVEEKTNIYARLAVKYAFAKEE